MVAQIWERSWELLVNSPRIKRWVVRRWYEYFSTIDRDGVMALMNYGYADGTKLLLTPADEPHRYGIQMYHHVASQVDVRELDLLEVGSGRGGGASYVMRYLRPRTYTGIEIAAGNVAFCQKRHRVRGLTFMQGDAEHLPFDDATFDALINIESSTHYGDIEQFFREVKRVLKPGGYFLYADTWQPHELDTLYRQFERAGLTCLRVEDMAANVARALDEDGARREQLITKYTPRFLRGAFMQFAGTRGSEKYDYFASGKGHYLCCTLQSVQPTMTTIGKETTPTSKRLLSQLKKNEFSHS